MKSSNSNINKRALLKNNKSVFLANRKLVKIKTKLDFTKKIIEQSPVVVFRWQNKKNIPVEFVSKNVKTIFGYPAKDFLSRNLYYETIHKDDAERVINEVKLHSNNSKINFKHKPYRVITKSGETKWVKNETLIIKDTKGHITHYEGILTDITKEIETKKQLQKSEEKYRTLFEKTNDAILLIENGLFIDCNVAALNMFGYKNKSEMLGLHPAEISPEKQYDGKFSDKKANFMIAIAEKKQETKFEWIHKKASGKNFHAQVWLTFIKYSNRKIFHAIVRDLTKTLELELKLTNKKNELSIAHQISKVGSWQLNINTQEITLSVEHQILLGEKLERVTMPLSDYAEKYIVSDDIAIIKDCLSHAIKNINNHKYKDYFEYRIKTNNEKVKYFAVNSSFSSKGIIHGITQNITDRKIAEQKIKQQNKELIQAEKVLKNSMQKYNLITDNITDFIWMMDLNLKAQYISPSCKKFIGYSEDEIRTNKINKIHPPDTIIKLKNTVSDALGTYKDNPSRRIEVEYIHKDGHTFPAEVYGYIISDDTGNPKFIGGISRNISKQKEAEEKLKMQKKIIEKAHKQIIYSIDYTKTIQESLLTNKKQLNKYFKQHFLLYKPKNQIGGDFYYVKKTEDNLIFSVGDCTGHGVPGAFLSVLGITHLNEVIEKKEVKDVGLALDLVRERFKNAFKTLEAQNLYGIDIALCAVNNKTKVLNYAGAFNPVYIIRKGELIELKATRNPIGFYPKEINFVNNEIQLQKNDMIYIFSDGFQDQVGGNSAKKFSIKQLKQLPIIP